MVPGIMQHMFSTRTTATLQKGMEGTLVQTQVSMNNLANVDTPGFKRQTVEFRDQLKTALEGHGIFGRTTDYRHIPIRGTGTIGGVTPRMTTDTRTSFRADGNNVDVDQEMVAVTGAAGKNVNYTELLSRMYSGYQSAIRGRT